MESKEPVQDSPTGWVKNHITEYVETDGEKGHEWRGVHTLLLTTRGRKTGALHRTALIYGQDGDRYMIVASNGGAPKHPNWYLNLSANPEVELQVGADKFKARARTANAEEKPRLWEIMAKLFPNYIQYQEKAARQIPVVILERI
jgi:deazaflavin-dependent oxidoreductase (nitroreductase family)